MACRNLSKNLFIQLMGNDVIHPIFSEDCERILRGAHAAPIGLRIEPTPVLSGKRWGLNGFDGKDGAKGLHGEILIMARD